MFFPDCGDCESTPCVCEGVPEWYEKPLEHVCNKDEPFSNYCAACREYGAPKKEKKE